MESNPGVIGRRWVLVGMITTVAAIFSLFVNTTEGAHPETGLAASNFEIDSDANLKFDDAAPSIDWAHLSVVEVRQDDMLSGSEDDSFGKGTKEVTAVPTPVTGSIPPNKSDLKTFGVYLEENGTEKFMHLFWTRVQDPKGTTNMDFEFNQAAAEPLGTIPPRTDGDLLIEYKLSKGGTEPDLYRYTWIDAGGSLTVGDCVASSSLPCWGDKTDLTLSGDAAGSINTSAISAVDSDGMGDLDPHTFGEATVDLNSIFDPNKCKSFGSAYLKSRSSDSFTAALKDFIAPQTVNISNCGTVIIVKNTVPSDARGDFHFSSNILTDPAVVGTFRLDGGNDDETISNVLSGRLYEVTEDNADSPDWDLTDINCGDGRSSGDTASATATIYVETGETVTCAFTNTKRGYSADVGIDPRSVLTGPGGGFLQPGSGSDGQGTSGGRR